MSTAIEQVNWAKGKVSRIGIHSKTFVISVSDSVIELSKDLHTLADVRYIRRKLIASIALSRYTPDSESYVNRVATREMQVLAMFKAAKELSNADYESRIS